MRDKFEAQERITAELHAKLADADQRYNAEMSMREKPRLLLEELQTRPRTGTALDELAADLDEAQETLAEESERRQAAEAALAAKGGWSADLDATPRREPKRWGGSWKMLGCHTHTHTAALQAELDAPSELDALAGELRAEAAVAARTWRTSIPKYPNNSRWRSSTRSGASSRTNITTYWRCWPSRNWKRRPWRNCCRLEGPEAVVEVKEKARVDCEAKLAAMDYAQRRAYSGRRSS